MWEEKCESIRVHRHQLRDADSDEEFVLVETEKSPLLPDESQPASSSTESVDKSDTSRLREPAEPLILDLPELPMKMVLSSWGVSFSSPDSTPSSAAIQSTSEPSFYGLLSVDEPSFTGRAGQVAERFGTSATNQKRGFEMKWDRPDFKILYKFNSLSDYRGVVRDIQEGKLRDVKVKGQTYRAVALEPVRVIDATLKCFLHMAFPLSICEDIKASLQPLLNTVEVAQKFIFIPSIEHHQQLSVAEATDSAHNQEAPPIIITLITSQPETSTARKISEVIKSSQDWKVYKFQCDSNPFKNREVYQHKKYGSHLPLISVTAGSGGWSMDNGVRVTLLCREKYDLMVEFYSLVLNTTHSPKAEDHTIFSLMELPTSVLELTLQKCAPSGVSPSVSGSIQVHFIIEKLTSVIVKLCRKFPACELTKEGCSGGQWKVKDPVGNEVMLLDRGSMEVCL